MQNINDKMLTAAAVLFVGLLLAALLLQWWLAPAYKTDNLSLHSQLSSGEMLIKPWQLHEIEAQDALGEFALVQLNGAQIPQSEKFGRQISVTTDRLLSDESMKFIKSAGKTLVVAPDESEALAAAWLLRAKGFGQVFAVATDAEFIAKNVLENYLPKWAQTTSEQARYAFSRFFGTASRPTAPAANFALPSGTPQVKKAAGGC
ncbi:MAG: hypothetical protein IPM52_11615 [Bacteroidetes bacterium]|nr:hypothetical protein [Bacteroidota bacterium]